jgi:hypothetical protein
VTHCENSSDCLIGEICDANYCVSPKIEDSKALFSLKFVPSNTINNNKYYHSFTTEILDGEYLKSNNSFEVSVSDFIEFSGEIKNNKELDISYDLTLSNENIRFYNHSYKDGESTYFYFKLPKGTYKLNVFPDKFYPPFTINLEEFKENIENHLIIVDREINSENYINTTGRIKVAIDDSIYFPNSYTMYAFTQENDSEEIISNRFTCNKDCEAFKLTIFNTNKKIFLKIKLDLLEFIEFKIPIEDFSNSRMSDIEIDLGNIYRSNTNKLILTGNSNEEIKNLEISIIGNINKYAIYKNTFYYSCTSSECNNTFNAYQGSLNMFIKPNNESSYISKFLNIDFEKEASNIEINLENKKLVSGVLISTDGSSIEGLITFTKKDNSLTDVKVQIYSNINGEFSLLMEPGEYDIFIEPKNSSINNSNWIYLNQRITVNTNNLLYIIPRSYRIPLHLYAQGNKPLAQAQVTMSIHDLKNIFYKENGYLYPESYNLYESITDLDGKFILSIPIIEE